jgi:flotillin
MYILIALGVVLVLILSLLKCYTVVEPNKAHVVVFMGSGRKVYSPHMADGIKKPTSYFFIPMLMKRTILPLTNVKMEIDGFELTDANVAPFMCEVTCWFRIEQPEIAVEKLDIDETLETAVRGTLEELIRGISRASAMKQEVLDIMRDRKTFGDSVEKEVNGALEEWGLELVKLEIIDFSDPEGSSVIADYENMRKSEISSNSRKIVAAQNKDANVVEAESIKQSGVARAESDREVQKAEVEKNKQVLISQEQANQEVAMQRQLANVKKVEAERALTVGQATVQQQATVTLAEGEAKAVYTKGKASADVVQATGTAEAVVVESKGLAEAKAKDAMAEALKKYNDSGINLEKIKAYVDVQKTMYENLGMALQAAHINLVGGAEGNSLFGFDLGSKGGAGLGQFIKSLEATTGLDAGQIIEKVKEVTKK